MKLSDLKINQSFKLATSDNVCIFKGYVYIGTRKKYFYECVNSGNEIETFNDYEVLT
jgi:hypothetical protein